MLSPDVVGHFAIKKMVRNPDSWGLHSPGANSEDLALGLGINLFKAGQLSLISTGLHSYFSRWLVQSLSHA